MNVMKNKTIIAAIIGVLAVATIIYFQLWQYIKPNILKEYLESFGIWTPIVYCLLYLVAVFIPHAGTAMTIVGGLLFAPLFGTALVIVISTLGSVFPFLLAKKYGRERIKSRIEKTKYKKYLHHTDKNSFMFVLYLRLLPIMPYELQNYVIGLVDISITNFIIATFVGLLPGTFMLVYLGNTITDISRTNIIILVSVSIFALVLPIVLKKYTNSKKILEIKDEKVK